MSTDRDSSVAGDGKKRLSKPQQTSSYWRVNEMEMFPKHLLAHGKNWTKIAEEMGTKTAQQVRSRKESSNSRSKIITQRMQRL